MLKLIASMARVSLVLCAVFIVAGICSVMTLTYIKLDNRGMVPYPISIRSDQLLKDERPQPRGVQPIPYTPKGNGKEYEV